MLRGAMKECAGYPNLSFQQGSASSTGLGEDSQDLIVERALIHHVDDVEACFADEGHRPQSSQVIKALKGAGFNMIEEIVSWETRALYESKESLLEDIRTRTGRSILFDLDDKELEGLVGMLNEKISVNGPLEEKDRWTIWKAVK